MSRRWKKSSTRHGVRYGIGLVLCLTVIGCTDPTSGVVSGTIMIDGKLPKTGFIGFTSTDGKTGPAGAEIVDGTYTATLPIGDAKVEIRVPKVVGKKKLYNTRDSPIQEVTEESLPPRYNDETELLYTVVAGEATKDFDLSTKKK